MLAFTGTAGETRTISVAVIADERSNWMRPSASC
jgi:hypothetical protein